ncbi:uncharacterized protein LOC110440387 [Mizuhopecten yessoensis]|uniref:uncharacterized protein LOC110440387 n=1 Tax=Mizuhopecten yessoensis TaxID=6573 RepID=UPI000B45873A|nr:uncharacterized protein LOC110440387 [Mizuhopecten yessoensis]
MTGRGEEQTLKEIYYLLKDRVLSLTRDKERVVNENDRIKDTLKKTARKLRSTSSDSSDIPRPRSADSIQMSEEDAKVKRVIKIMESRHLSISREQAKTETVLTKVNDKLQQLEKSLVGILDSDKSRDNTVLELLLEVRSSVNECRQSQTHTDGQVEKISVGIQQLLENQQNVAAGNLREVPIPVELNYFCSKMQAQGTDFHKLGRALNIEESVLGTINQSYGDDEEDEKFQQVIREWAKKSKNVHIRDFVGACHMSGGNTVKDKPLAPKEKEKLLQNVSYLCDNMLDVPLVLPHLVTKSVISPRLSEYVLAPSGRIERILRLVDVLCTKESGFEEFCAALKSSDQAHVAENMIGGGQVRPECGKRSASFSVTIKEREEDAQSTMPEDAMVADHDILRSIALLLHNRGIM